MPLTTKQILDDLGTQSKSSLSTDGILKDLGGLSTDKILADLKIQQTKDKNWSETVWDKIKDVWQTPRPDLAAGMMSDEAKIAMLTPDIKTFEFLDWLRNKEPQDAMDVVQNLAVGATEIGISIPSFWASILLKPKETSKELVKWFGDSGKDIFNASNYLAIKATNSENIVEGIKPGGLDKLEESWKNILRHPENPPMMFLAGLGVVRGITHAGKYLKGKKLAQEIKIDGIRRLSSIEPDIKLLSEGKSVATEPIITPEIIRGRGFVASESEVYRYGGALEAAEPVIKGYLPDPTESIITIEPQQVGRPIRPIDTQARIDLMKSIETEYLHLRDAVGDADFVTEGLDLARTHINRLESNKSVEGVSLPKRYSELSEMEKVGVRFKSESGNVRLPTQEEIMQTLRKIDDTIGKAYQFGGKLPKAYSEDMIRRSAERQGLDPDAVMSKIMHEGNAKIVISEAGHSLEITKLSPDKVVSNVIQDVCNKVGDKLLDATPNSLLGRLRYAFTNRFGAIPEAIERYGGYKNFRHQMDTEADWLAHDVVKDFKNEDAIIFDRLMRGEQQAFVKDNLEGLAEDVKGKFRSRMQEFACRLEAMGLPIIEQFKQGVQHWYPYIYKKRVGKTVAGEAYLKTGSMRASAGEKGHTKPRVLTRYTVMDSNGIYKERGNLAVFDNLTDAQAFVDKRSGYRVVYKYKGEGNKWIEDSEAFPTRKARADFIKSLDADFSVMSTPDPTNLHVAHPMTLEQLITEGLVENPVFNIKRGYREQAGLIGKVEFWTDIAKIDGVLNDVQITGKYTQTLKDWGFNIPEAWRKNNPLLEELWQGKYIHDDIARDMVATFDSKRGIVRSIWDSVEVPLRGWVTHRNPFRYIRQMVENELWLYINDTKAFLNKPAQIKAFREGIDSFFRRKPTPEWKTMSEHGIAQTVFLDTEIPAHTMKYIEEAMALDTRKPLSLSDKLTILAEETPVVGDIMKLDQVARAVYNFQDLIYKYYLYKTYLGRGLSPKEAARMVKGGFFDWSNRPRIIEKLRFIPFIPSVTWQFARTLSFLFKEKPVSMMMKTAFTAGAFTLLREGMMQVCGISKEENERAGKFGIKMTQVPVPWTDDNGYNQALDIKSFVFLYDAINILPLDENDTEWWKSAALKSLPMAIKPLLSIVNVDTWGNDVYNPDDPMKHNMGKLARSMFLAYRPGLLGQYEYRWQRNIERGEELQESFAEKMILEPMFGNVEHFKISNKIQREMGSIAGAMKRLHSDYAKLSIQKQTGQINDDVYQKQRDVLVKRMELLEKRHRNVLYGKQDLNDRKESNAKP